MSRTIGHIAQQEQIYLGSCLLEPSLIDEGIQGGIKADSFASAERSELWTGILKMRALGQVIDVQSICLEMGQSCPMDELFSCEKSCATHANGRKALRLIVEGHAMRQLKPALHDILSQIDDGEPYEAVKSTLEAIPALLRPSAPQEHTLSQIIDDAALWAKEQVAGNSTEKVITTGFPSFDHRATPIQKHEYVIVGARTSQGKSSFLAQLCNHSLNRGLRCAYFTLETSARSVALQIAAQRSRINLRRLKDEMPDRQKAFHKELEHIKTQNLIVFEKDLSLEQIEARCRLLTVSFKPDVVFWDYLGLTRVKADGAYERMSKLSKACIPIKKSLDCALIVAAQLNRGNEKEDRPPTRTDFRDTGSIEEDAHRIICLHRPSKDDSGQLQGYDKSEYLTEIYQLKLRDGPLCQGRLNFYANQTRFDELT